MKRKLICLLFCLALTCATATAQIRLTDMMGREIELDEAPERVVALTAAEVEILYAIGAQEALVGRGAYCDYPDEALRLPQVDSGAQTNIEQILALEPDAVLLSTMSQTVEQNQALEAAGVCVVVSNANDIEGVYALIRQTGALMDRQKAAEAVVAQMQARFDALSGTAQGAQKSVYFEVSPLAYGLWTAGSGTFMDEIAQICGLRNAFGDVEGWAEISQEQVLERNPDYIVTVAMDAGDGPTPVEEICARAGWESLTAVRDGGVFALDYDALTRPGPRLAQAAEDLYALTHESFA